MTLKFYTGYIGRSHRLLSGLSKKTGSSILYHWFDFIWCTLVHGAIINHYVRGNLYRLKGCERRKSMTYRRIIKAYSKMNEPESIKILNNKHLFNAHFAPFVQRKWLYSSEMNFDQFCKFCDSCETIIVKPEDGVEGVGIRKIASPHELRLRSKLFDELHAGSFMVEECLQQHPSMIYGNTSVNTIRAHSIIDNQGNVHLLKMLFRVGVGDSVVDNYAHGGCVYEVQLETGRIISPSLKKDGSEVFIHPQTDIFMLGRQIPNWDKVCDGVKKAHVLLTGCRFIGWDVAVTKDGIELIEGNHNPDYELFEFFGSKGWWKEIKKYI